MENEVPPADDRDATESKMDVESTSNIFLGMPGEIRNQVYEYALLHHKNKGVIAPIMTNNEDLILVPRPEVFTIINGKPRRILCRGHIAHLINYPLPSLLPTGRYEFDHLTHLANGESENDICGFLVENDKISGTYEIKTPFIGHICTTQCLLHPALTRVSRQIREESLPIFYGANRFHLNIAEQYSHSSATKTTVIAWWRTIEDTNLRMIKYLYVEDDSGFTPAFKLTWRA